MYAQQIVVDNRGCAIIWAVNIVCWWSMIDVSHASIARTQLDDRMEQAY